MSVPEVRQSLDPAAHHFGHVAIKLDDHCWEVHVPSKHGSSLCNDDHVASWDPINDDAVKKHATDPEHVETVPVDGGAGHLVVDAEVVEPEFVNPVETAHAVGEGESAG